MAEEKKNGKSIEITFKLKDHLTNTGIGNAEIELYSKTGNKFSKKGKSSNNGIVKITIDEEDLKKKLYVKLVQSDDYYEYPFPNSTLPTYAICYRRDRTQEIRFLSKRCVVGIVKAYNHQIGSIYSSESEYLSNWQDEILTIDKEQTITLKAFIVSNISEEEIREPNGRYFLNNSELEDEFSANIYWAFTIVDNIAGFSSSDESNSLRRDIDDKGNGMYLYLHEEGEVTKTIQQKNNTKTIQNLDTFDKHLNRNSLQQFKIYKLMKSGEEVTGHTINFKLSDVLSKELLNGSNFLDRYCIIFFAYIKEDNQNSKNTDNNTIEVKYYSGKDSVPSIELKMVANKYSMVFDGYHLELYKNGKYIESYNARLTENGNLRKREEFKFTQKDGIDDLYKCEAKLRSKVVDNMLRRVLYLKPDSDNNDVISNFIVDNVMLSNIENQLKPKKDSDNNNQSNTQNNITSKVIHISSIDFIKLWHKIQFQSDILVKFIYQPKYVIEVTRYKEKYNYDTSTLKGRYGATYGVFAVYVYYMGEKFLLDSVIDVYNSKYKDDENKVIDTANIIRENIEELNRFVNDFKNHDSIKTDMYEKDLQNKATYGNLIYGGYTMEPAGPDCMTSNLKRRIPEGHYKGKLRKYDSKKVTKKNRHKHLTMNLYSDMVRAERFILVHAGTKDISFTTGCVLVSSQSYITGNDNITKSQNTKNLLYNLYLFLYNIAIAPKENKANNKLSKKNENKPLEKDKELSQYINVVIRNKFEKFGE